MTKALAPSFRALLLGGDIDIISDSILVVALDATYTYSATHDFFDDVTASAIVATSSALGTKTATDGYFDSANPSMGSPVAGDTITQFWLYNNTPATDATKQLIYYFDEDAAGSAISVATDGGEITVTVPASGWFRV